MNIKRCLGQLYWSVRRWWNDLLYRTTKWLNAAHIWVKGILKEDWHDSEAECVVICAHPDDETIFFSSVLRNKKPFVVCMSHCGNEVRKQEFLDAMAYWGLQGTMLNLPDVPGFVWAWRLFASFGLRKLKSSLPNVKTIFTHNTSGESGHPHHYAIGASVIEVFSDCKIYITARTVPADGGGALSEEEKQEKLDVVRKCYTTQIKMLETWCPWWEAYLSTEYFEE